MRIVIADDHALFRSSLRGLLAAKGFEVLGEAGDGRRAVDLARELHPDVVLMDLDMPGMDGMTAMRQIVAEVPGVKVVVLTGADEDEKLFEAIKAGAQGYLLKNLESDQFLSLLERLGQGEPALTPGLANKLLKELARPARPNAQQQDPDALTDREREVLELIVQGITSNRKLARQLNVSENTVKFHVRNILDKLHLHNRAQAVGFALRHNVVPAKPRKES